MSAQNPHSVRVFAYNRGNKSDPARCVNTMCAGPCRTGLEFD
jgi:hypothetical protein